ncbi:hypothetical protein HOY82DRAFT_542187 [Tuber indicum]|nr:hypothetical protein HOY82DRAFT_542187 [Tuber indicum]
MKQTSYEVPELKEVDIQAYIDQREEQGVNAGNRLAKQQDNVKTHMTAGYRKPNPGDLVLLRDFQLAKDKGRKLEPRWSTPRLLERVSKSGVSAHVRQLHDPPGTTKRYHLDDLLLYIPRTKDYPSLGDKLGGVGALEYERGAMGDVRGIWQVGQRGFDLSDLGG